METDNYALNLVLKEILCIKKFEIRAFYEQEHTIWDEKELICEEIGG